jgi:hypothetical protein
MYKEAEVIAKEPIMLTERVVLADAVEVWSSAARSAKRKS